MVTIKTGYKSVVLAVAMASTGFCGASMPAAANMFASFVPSKDKVAMAALALVIGLKIHLDTQKSCDDYKLEDWYDDVKSLLKSYDLWNAESRKTVKDLMYKWIRGSKLKLKERTIRVKNEDGSIETLKDKKLICKPFGLMGWFDAYVLGQLKPMQDYAAPALFMLILMKDPLKYFSKTEAK